MNATQLLVKAYQVDNAGGVTQYAAVVVNASTDGKSHCKLPTAANVPGFLGFTLEAQPNQYKGAAVQKSGIARATANGTIAYGDRLVIASTAGDVKSVEATIAAGPLDATATEYNVVGRAEESAVNGQIFGVWITPETVTLAVS
jgi:hypothetical protein